MSTCGRAVGVVAIAFLALVIVVGLLHTTQFVQATAPIIHRPDAPPEHLLDPLTTASQALPKVITTVLLPSSSDRDYAVIRVNPSTGYSYLPSFRNNNLVVLSDTRVMTTIPIGPLASLLDVNPATGYVYAATNVDIKVVSGTQVITSHSPGFGGPFEGKVNVATGYVYVGSTANRVAVPSSGMRHLNPV